MKSINQPSAAESRSAGDGHPIMPWVSGFSRFGCVLRIFARKNACNWWALRLDDKQLESYFAQDLRFDGGWTNEVDGRLIRLPMLRKSQAARLSAMIAEEPMTAKEGGAS